MKKILLFALVAAVTFTSCKKKSNDDDSETDLFKLKYSNLTVEQHKQKIEESGVQFLEKISSLPDEKFIDVLDFMLTLEPSTSSISSVLAVKDAAKSKSLPGLFKATTSASTTTERLSDLYAIYTWNPSLQDWVETPSTSKLEFRFPSAAGKLTNDAVLSMSYTASNVTVESEEDDLKVELPASVITTLRVGAKDELKFVSSYAYKTDGTPTKVDISLILGSFTLKTKVNNEVTALNSEFSISKGTEVLMSLKTSASGNMTVDNAQSSDDFDQVVKNANATFEIMNLKLAGQVDFKAIRDAEKAASNLKEAEQSAKEAIAWNTYSKLVAVNSTDNTIIAKVQFQSASDEYCYSNYPYNTQTCYTNYYMEPSLVFKDDSKMSIEEFFDSGFGQLIDDLEDYEDEFE